ncbi:MAG: DUF5309 domain-containing protein [Phycisphaerales bacterium]|nr:DUF5309 domain-containing protein [Phycisphaerales bacterium]
MPFTGKATFSAGQTLPEFMEDVADLVSIVSPFETPLLDHLGDGARSAASTIHEWIEDDLLTNADSVNQSSFSPNAQDATAITVANGSRFRVGDQVRPWGSKEVMLATAVAGNAVTFTRRYGNSPASNLTNGQKLVILANAALEGDDAPDARFTTRSRKRNYTQIFSATVQVSGTVESVRAHAVGEEIEYQKTQRIRELLRDLENCVINGFAPAANQAGTSTVRRTMNGLLASIATNQFLPNTGPIPVGDGGGADFNEAILNAAMRTVWESTSARIDTIVVGSTLKRRMNAWLTPWRTTTPQAETYRNLVTRYESDFGRCSIIVSRNVAPDTVLLLDSSRVGVLPLAGRSFHYKPMGAAGDRTTGMLIGEYTLELRNEQAHAVIRGLT